MEAALAQLIGGSGGYAATVGGNVKVFGTSDIDLISLADIAGTITFDGSFNRGGDFILLPNAAKAYTVARSGSSVTITDADSSITIPVGTKGTTLQFSDGEVVLKFNGQVQLGSQVITTTSASITATLSAKTTLPTATSSTGTLILAPNDPVLIGGNVKIFGTNGADTVTVADIAGNISFDGSFNRGGDKIILSKFAENYSISRSGGSNVTLGDTDTKLTIPLGTKGLSVEFSNEARNLVYGKGDAYLGNQAVLSDIKGVIPYLYNLKFKEIKDPFDGNLPYGNTTFGPLPDSIDVNGDGYKDLIFLFQENKYLYSRGTIDPDGPSNSQIRIFINNKGMGFSDRTFDFIDQNLLDGQTTRSTVYDINGDGRLDIIYPTSREDGRNLDNPFHATTKFKVLLSVDSGKYQIIELGQKDWYNDAEVFLINGKLTFTATGYRPETYNKPQEFFEFEGGEIRQSDFKILEKDGNYLHVLGWGFHFYDRYSGSMSVNTLFSPTSKTLESGATVRGFNIYNSDESGVWRYATDFYNLNGTFVKKVEFTQWNLAVYSTDVFDLGGGMYGVRPAVYGATTSIKLFPNSRPVFITTQYDTVIFSDDIEAIKMVVEDKTQTYGKLLVIDFDGSNVTSYDLKIDGFDPYNLTSEIMEVRDFNRDGYDDIVMYTWDKSLLNTIFINKRDGTFYRFDVEELKKDIRYDSIYDDFNNDGNIDIISLIADGQWDSVNVNMSGFLYYQSYSGVLG